MKKKQRQRLAALLAKPADSLTTAEQAELSTLTLLAARHPDASQDTDDTPAPAAAPAATAPVVIAEPPPSGGDPATTAARPGIRAQVAAAIAAVRGGQAPAAAAAAAVAQNQTLTAENTRLTGALATATTTLATAQTRLTAITQYLGITPDELAACQDTAAITTLVATRTKANIADELAALGFPAANLPATTPGDAANATVATGSASEIEELRTQLANTKDPKKKGELAAKIRELRNPEKTKK
ncbi:MAG: hypothetical protein LBK99_27470 [Opitutaceae bacterium]|jgi:hypothetical protein|nr:hypothetical protein [Opitutaceae bacterium]